MRAIRFLSPRRSLHTFAALLLAGAVGGFVGCGLSTEGQPADDSAKTCTEDLACTSEDLCKIGSCGADGLCIYKAVPDGEPAIQVPGDCKRVTCSGGQAAEGADESDNDDGNPCTKDSCEGVAATHEKLSNVQCGEGGACQDGVCVVACASATDNCEDGNPCTKGSCDLAAGQCVQEPTHGALVENADASDCVEIRCNQDVATTVPNDAEVPDDGKDCTVDSCSGGVKLNTPVGKDAPCMGGVCDAVGQCVGCNDATTCSGTDNDCQTRTCVNAVCGFSYVDAGTPVPGQTANDCKVVVCNGTGGTATQQDSNDKPVDDGLQCTAQECSGSNPSFPPVSINTPCAAGFCNATGICVQCNDAAQCTKGATCQTATCNNNVCGFASIPNGSDPLNECSDDGSTGCGNDGMCDGNGACRKYSSGTVCGAAACANGTQSNVDTCSGTGVCNDGGTVACGLYGCGATTCKTSCTSTSDCANGAICNTVTSVCEAKLTNGAVCANNDQCASAFCTDGVCCNNSCNSKCRTCSMMGSVGTCTAYANGSDPENCSGNQSCCNGSCAFGMCN